MYVKAPVIPRPNRFHSLDLRTVSVFLHLRCKKQLKSDGFNDVIQLQYKRGGTIQCYWSKVNKSTSRTIQTDKPGIIGTASVGFSFLRELPISIQPSKRSTSANIATATGSVTLDPTVVSRSSGSLPVDSSPEVEASFGGGGGNGGWKSPPGGGGDGESGDDQSWWDKYCEWWDNRNPFHLIVLGVRMRMAADPTFAFKLLVECGLDATIIIIVNILSRRDRFVSEAEFVLSQIAVSLLNDFALVYLLAPTPDCSVLRRGSLRAKLADLPAHVFQRAPTGVSKGYSLGARATCFLAKAVQYGTVGLVMGTAGSSLVLLLTTVRTELDKNYKPPPTYQPVLGTGIGWLLFMSGSSNIRYNLINCIEDIAYERFPGPKSKALSVGLRFSNNVFGAHAWMQLAKALKLNRPRRAKDVGRPLKSSPDEELITELPPVH